MSNCLKICITCRHFNLDLGQPHYSSLTPGSEGSVSCDKGEFDSSAQYNPVSAVLSKRDCPMWELSLLAANKGYTDA